MGCRLVVLAAFVCAGCNAKPVRSSHLATCLRLLAISQTASDSLLVLRVAPVAGASTMCAVYLDKD